MAVNEVSSCFLSDALVSAIDPEIIKIDLSAEVLDYVMGLKDVGGADVGTYDILLTPLSLDRTLYQIWWAIVRLKLYAVKHGRYVMPVPAMGGLKRTWGGLLEVFWGIAAVRFPRVKHMTLVRNGMDPCIIAAPEKDNPRVKVIMVGGGPEEEAFGKAVERSLNATLAEAQEKE